MNGASNIKCILLNIVNTSLRSTFYNWISSEWGISFLAWGESRRDLQTSIFAKVLSIIIASSWNSLFECSPKISRRICIHTKLRIKFSAIATSSLDSWCPWRKCMNILMSFGTNKFNDAKIIVIIPPTISSHLKVQRRLLNRALDFLSSSFISRKSSNRGGVNVSSKC